MTRRLWALPLATSIACTQLERLDIGENVCGNRVVEPDNDEDCDGDAPAGFHCGDPATRGACRYTCVLPADCPDNWSCGADGVCRYPSRVFEALPMLPGPSPLNEIAVAKVDPDDFDDLIQLGELEVQVRFGNERGDFTASQRFNVDVPIGQLATGDLDEVPGSEIIIGQIDGPLFLRGTADRKLEPVARSSIRLPLGPPSSRGGPEHARVLAVDLESDVEQQFGEDFFPGRDAVLIETTDRISFALPFNFLGSAFADLGVEGALLPHAIGIADVDGSPSAPAADEIAIAKAKGLSVFIAGVSCRTTMENGLPRLECTPNLKSEVTVHAPIFGGTYFGDLDTDGRLDLVVHVEGGLEYAFGLGDGTFCAVSGPVCPDDARDRTADTVLLFSDPMNEGQFLAVVEPPLFVGELGFSPGTDFIFAVHQEFGANLIAYSVTVNADGTVVGAVAQTASYGGFWSQIEVGDFNRDGVPDIAASRESGTLLDVWLGTQTTLYNPFTIPFSRTIGRIAVGDFDGDFFDDVAVYEIGFGVSVVFGSPSGPSETVLMSRSRDVINMVGVDVVSATSVDLITDLVLTSSTGGDFGNSGFALTLLNGSSKRRMLAPLTFLDLGKRQDEVFESANVGRFNDDSIDDLFLTTSSSSAASPRRLWFLAGSQTDETLPARVTEGERCPLSIDCLSPPLFANFENSDIADEALSMSICDGQPGVWSIDLQGLSLVCSRVDVLSDEVTFESRPSAVDIDGDGRFELLLLRESSIVVARTDDSGSWSLEEVSTDGAHVTRLIALKHGKPGASLAFITEGNVYVGSIEAKDGALVLVGDAVAPVPSPKSEISSGGGEIAGTDDPLGLLEGEVLHEIDIGDDEISDLIVYETAMLRQLECSARRERDGICTRPEVKPR